MELNVEVHSENNIVSPKILSNRPDHVFITVPKKGIVQGSEVRNRQGGWDIRICKRGDRGSPYRVCLSNRAHKKVM